MIRRLSLPALLLALSLHTQAAQAQRIRGGGSVTSPFGEVYNTNSPEYRQSGGDPILLEQLQEQKMMQQQMLLIQQMQKQQAAAEKQMQEYFKKNPEAKKQFEEEQKKLLAAQQSPPPSKTKSRKKKAVTSASAQVKTAATPKAVEGEPAPVDPAAKPSTDPAAAKAEAKKPTPTRPSLAAARGK